MKSARYCRFAMIPPTCAAASTTASGRSLSKNSRTADPSSRSSSRCVRPTRFVYPLPWRLSHIAEPTSPLCPATYILLSFPSMFYTVWILRIRSFLSRCKFTNYIVTAMARPVSFISLYPSPDTPPGSSSHDLRHAPQPPSPCRPRP